MLQTYGLSEADRAKAAENIMSNWPSVPSEYDLEKTLAYDRFITENVAPAQGRQVFDFPDPYGRKADLDLTSLLLPKVTFRKRRMETLVTALWTVKHSAIFHEAVGRLFSHLDMNRAQDGPKIPAHLLALTPEERRSVALREFMHSASEFGENRHSIGVAWTHPVPEQPGKNAHQFRMLPRNPDWMGFSKQLPLVKDCYFLICSAEGQSKAPGHAVGYPATHETLHGLKDYSRNFRSDEARTLAKILLHHGAAGCYWRPY